MYQHTHVIIITRFHTGGIRGNRTFFLDLQHVLLVVQFHCYIFLYPWNNYVAMH